jgi:hypothetical protein
MRENQPRTSSACHTHSTSLHHRRQLEINDRGKKWVTCTDVKRPFLCWKWEASAITFKDCLKCFKKHTEVANFSYLFTRIYAITRGVQRQSRNIGGKGFTWIPDIKRRLRSSREEAHRCSRRYMLLCGMDGYWSREEACMRSRREVHGLAPWSSERRKLMAIGAPRLGGRRQWRHQRVGKDELDAN